MRVAIASRIFEPEPAAASFRLAALAAALSRAGHDVTVLTAKPPKRLANAVEDKARPYRLRRFPVLRDSSGYVRGYLPYLSFDLPLFFRILFGRRNDFIITEPPPTTGVFVRMAAAIRRSPYVYYAADIWSDATSQTGVSEGVVRAVRALEQFAMRGARAVLSVNKGVTNRVIKLAPNARVHTVGNGVDTNIFSRNEARMADSPYVLYSGTASEWQGAGIFIEAIAKLISEFPGLRLVFLGQGSDWPRLKEKAARLPGGAVEFVPTLPAEEAAKWIRGAAVSVASIRPDSGYSFAFPTKVFASWACGTPVIFAGHGAVPDFFATHRSEVYLGEASDYTVMDITHALREVLKKPMVEEHRALLSTWAARNVSLDAVADVVVRQLADDMNGGAAK